MKARHLFAAFFLILELPVLLPLAVGALLTGLARGTVVLYMRARLTVVEMCRALRQMTGGQAARPALGS